MHNPVPAMVDRWRELRAELAAIEQAEHPDQTDEFGRVWTWWKGDLYRHDDTLAVPLDMISLLDLPRAGLAEDNPNYSKLCQTCRREAPGYEETTSMASPEGYEQLRGWL